MGELQLYQIVSICHIDINVLQLYNYRLGGKSKISQDSFLINVLIYVI